MQYTLITPTGRIYQFFVKAVAELYLLNNGGTLITNAVLENCISVTAESIEI